MVQSSKLLGGVIGDEESKSKFVDYMVEKWLLKLESITLIATQQPQVAYSALVRSLQSEWSFVYRVWSLAVEHNFQYWNRCWPIECCLQFLDVRDLV